MNLVRNHNRLINIFGKRLRQRCDQSLTTESSIQKPVLEPLSEREVVQVKGDEIVPFLQGLITNDIKHLHPSSNNAIYAMFLNKAGRVMYDVVLYTTSEPTKIFIECDKNITNELQRHLTLYRVRRKIDIVSLHDEYKVWQAFEPYKQSQNLMNAINKGEESDFITNIDPRLKQLGVRILARSDKKFSDLSQLFKEFAFTESNGNNFRLHRYNLGIAEGVGDMPPGKCFPLEANCDILNGVSFHKGCYIGQELTARVHHTGMIRKRHMPVKLSTSIPSGVTPVVQNEAGGNCGIIYGSISDRALGLLRVENVFKAKELLVNGNPCFTKRPQWWPVEIHPNVSKKTRKDV